MPDFTNALASAAPAGPAAPVATPPPAEKAAPAALNARPDKNANSSQVPGMMGDVKKNPAPPQHKIATSAPSPATQRGQSSQRTGMETAMSAMADKLHPTKKR